MKYIYRIEHSTVISSKGSVFSGPYGISDVCSSSQWQEEITLSYAATHPNPTSDHLLAEKIHKLKSPWNETHFCGFNSLEQYRRWFSNYELENLYALGFVLVKYPAKSVLVGETQVLFIPTGKRTILNRDGSEIKYRTGPSEHIYNSGPRKFSSKAEAIAFSKAN